MWSALAVAVAVSGGPATAAAPRLLVHTYTFVRTTTGPSSLSYSFDLAPDSAGSWGAGGFAGQIAAQVGRGAPTDVLALQTEAVGRYDDPQLASGPTTTRICAPAGGCAVERTLEYGGATSYRDSSAAGSPNRFFLVLEGHSTFRYSARGWRLASVRLAYRYTDGLHSSDLAVYDGDRGAEVFAQATLVGGSSGSVAAAYPPCSTSIAGLGAEPVPRGVGAATLTGGTATAQTVCPVDVFDQFLSGGAAHRTTWTFQGPVVGDPSLQHVRLFVVDLPAIR